MGNEDITVFTIGLSGRPPERSAAVLELPASEIYRSSERWTASLSDHTRSIGRSLPHPSRLVKGEWPARSRTGTHRGDIALGQLLFRRLADDFLDPPAHLTAVHLGKRHIDRAVHGLLSWLCTERLAGRPAARAVLHTCQGIRWVLLTPQGPSWAPPWLPSTTSEALLGPARLAAYAYDLYRRIPDDADLPNCLPDRPSWVKEAVTV